MTCPCEFLLPISFSHLINPMLKKIEVYVAKYSRFNEDSLLSAMNRTAGEVKGCELDIETCHLLEFVDMAYEVSEKNFDPSVKALVDLWSFKRAKIPSDDEVAEALASCGWHFVRWSKRQKKIWLPKGFSLDFGGFVKEYIADQLVRFARQQGCCSGLINLGGDIAAIDENRSDSPWRVGIRHVKDSAHPSAYIDVAYGAVATSGSYERQFTVDGRSYSHIISPRTGYPVEQIYQSISVHHASCLMSGFLATVGMIKQQQAVQWLTSANTDFYLQTCV